MPVGATAILYLSLWGGEREDSGNEAVTLLGSELAKQHAILLLGFH